MIPFNMPPRINSSLENVISDFQDGILRGDGPFCKKCSRWMEDRFSIYKVLITGSCTHALELSAILCDITPGDEVIMPSYTFCSTANAFALRGAKIVFVDIRPDTMNINEKLIEAAITEKTKVIVPVHYAGISCEMDEILRIAKKYGLSVVEDAAQGMMCSYKGKPLGSMGTLGTYSFHETKNYSMGEGGALLINDQSLIQRAEIIREKGTNRSMFLRGQVDKYSWVDIGSSFLPCDLAAANLYGQLEIADEINTDRLSSWNYYYESLLPLANEGKISLPFVPEGCIHNAHMFYIKVKDLDERTAIISYLKGKGIISLFHYIPLHSSKAGLEYGSFHGEDLYTTKESERLLRLPMFYKLKKDDVFHIAKSIKDFYK